MLTKNEVMEIEHRKLTIYTKQLAEVRFEKKVFTELEYHLLDQIAKTSYYFQVDDDGIIEPGLGCC